VSGRQTFQNLQLPLMLRWIRKLKPYQIESKLYLVLVQLARQKNMSANMPWQCCLNLKSKYLALMHCVYISRNFTLTCISRSNYRIEEDELEVLTCTDIEQRWDQLKASTLAKFEGGFLADCCLVVKAQSPFRRTVKQVTEDMAVKFRSLFIEGEFFTM